MTAPPSEVEVLDWAAFGEASRELATLVAGSGYRPGIILGIARGGLLPAAAMAYALDVKNLFMMSVEFYTGVDQRLDFPVMLPPLLQSTHRSGSARLTWLKKLKAWNWNCALALSPKLTVLNRPALMLKNFGPRNAPIPAFPKPSRVAVWPHGPAVLPSASRGMPLVV